MPKTRLDYSGYQPNEIEKYHAVRSGNSDVLFDYFHNGVSEHGDKKILMVSVDDFHEDEYMNNIYAAVRGEEPEAHDRSLLEELIESNPDYYADEQAQTARNQAVLERYGSRFEIEPPSPFEHPSENKSALNNAFSGSVVYVPLGEGILDFCYADFAAAFKRFQLSLGLFYDDNVKDVLREIFAPSAKAPPELKPEPIHSREEEMIFHYSRYTETMTMLDEVIYASLYTAIFPPVILSRSKDAEKHYARYLASVQAELLELLEFCFDDTFFPDVLGDLHPAERFALYGQVKDRPTWFSRTEVFQLDRSGGSSDTMPFGISADQLLKRVGKKIDITEEHRTFMERFGIQNVELEVLLKYPFFVNVSYDCSNLYDMLFLEFTKMLEHGIRFKKCKNCGRYFILKGNYKTDYCDRVPAGETQSCQTIASLRNYREKVSGNAAWQLYNKYYKRYHARMKAGNIPQDTFKQWQYKATAMRDNCAEGKVSAGEFDAWLYGSFPNNPRKES